MKIVLLVVIIVIGLTTATCEHRDVCTLPTCKALGNVGAIKTLADSQANRITAYVARLLIDVALLQSHVTTFESHGSRSESEDLAYKFNDDNLEIFRRIVLGLPKWIDGALLQTNFSKDPLSLDKNEEAEICHDMNVRIRTLREDMYRLGKSFEDFATGLSFMSNWEPCDVIFTAERLASNIREMSLIEQTSEFAEQKKIIEGKLKAKTHRI